MKRRLINGLAVLAVVAGCGPAAKKLASPGAAAIPAKPILVFNEDDSHMLRKMPAAKYAEYFDSVCRGAVTHFFMCPNAMRSNIPSQSLEPVWKALEEPWKKPGWAPTAKWLNDNGIDPYAIWSGRAREKGVSPWLTMRMNDIHSPTDPSFCSLSTTWRTMPETRRVPGYTGGDWHKYAFDYAHEIVRKEHIGYIRELLEKYDVDGLELDWMRFPYHLAPGREKEDAHYLTEVVREARKAADKASKRLGHPVKIGCRVTTAYGAALALGTDPVLWAKEGLIDWLVVCNFFGTVDFNMDYADWKKRIQAVNPAVTIVPGLDSGVVKDYGGSGRQLLTLEEYRGWLDAQYSQGAPGVYLFNPFHFAETSMVWNAMLDGGFAPDAVAAAKRAYPVSHRECAPEELMDKQLPKQLTENFAFAIRAGTPPEAGNVELLLAFDGVFGDAARKTVRLNGVAPSSIADAPLHPWLDPKTKTPAAIRLAFPFSALAKGVNRVTLGPAKTEKGFPVSLVACELEVTP